LTAAIWLKHMFAFPNLLACFYFTLTDSSETEKSKSRPGTPVAVSYVCSVGTKFSLGRIALSCPKQDGKESLSPWLSQLVASSRLMAVEY